MTDKYPPPRAVVFDDTAALALGAGNRMASRLVVEAEKDPALRVYIPALCLAVAERDRAGVAEHVGALPSVDITELDFVAAAAVGKRLRTEAVAKGMEDWSGAHALHLALPSVEWPRGRPVLTRIPTRYKDTGIRTILIVGQN
ncbi:hypothetical protein NLX86_07275 [Streptomyces sp. A3M-1-3]|uniref:hypothetical protein n=1 Tax=Streptomyces sp. A3M-1-3 TaxID=2962044 RepID=UPI0020B68846|nr:hypothetical protein [Streptomyces sp. A3M-1-3]MCP3817941.1 hypothetical protein [Streptomyces sp. A3M-1-3]